MLRCRIRVDACEATLEDAPPLVLSLWGSGGLVTKPSLIGVCRVELASAMLRLPPYAPHDEDLATRPAWRTLQRREADGLVPTATSLLVAVDVLSLQLSLIHI